MTIEELLKPRYEVMADYPNSLYKIGGIIEGDEHGSFVLTKTRCWNSEWAEYEDCENLFPIGVAESYPALFKKLEWWEERELSQLPEYLKFDYGKHFKGHMPTGKENIDKVWKVQKWDLNMINQPVCHDKNKDGNDFLSIEWWFYKNSSTPATEQEYLNQNQL